MWLGWPVAAAAAVAAIVLWACVWAGSRARLGGRTRAFAAGGGIMLLAALFVAHKLNIEYSGLLRSFLPPAMSPMALGVLKMLAALSFSYAVLRAVDLSSGVLSGSQQLLNPLACLGYLFPFHMLLAGPIASYGEFVEFSRTRRTAVDLETILTAGNHIATGLVYKYVISAYLAAFVYGSSSAIVIGGLGDTLVLLIYVFFDFAGYSRIALGVGKLMDVPTPENFRAPFLATTVTDFFTRWHCSLGNSIRRLIYTPLQVKLVRTWGIRRAQVAGFISLLASWIVVGLWHRLSWAFLGYGASLAVWIWVEKYIRDLALQKSWSRSRVITPLVRILAPAYVFLTLVLMLHLISREILPS